MEERKQSYYVTTNHKHWSMSSALGNGKYTGRHNRVLDELVGFIKSYMKSELTISTQKFVSERTRIYTSSKQTIKHQAIPSQNLLGPSGDWEVSPTYLDGIMITQKQYLAKVCDKILFFCQERTLKSL